MPEFTPDPGMTASIKSVQGQLSSLESSVERLGQSFLPQQALSFADSLRSVQLQTGMTYEETERYKKSIIELNKVTNTYRIGSLTNLTNSIRTNISMMSALGKESDKYIKLLTTAFPRGAEEANRALMGLQRSIPEIFTDMKSGKADVATFFELFKKGGLEAASAYKSMIAQYKENTPVRAINELSETWSKNAKIVDDSFFEMSQGMEGFINKLSQKIPNAARTGFSVFKKTASEAISVSGSLLNTWTGLISAAGATKLFFPKLFGKGAELLGKGVSKIPGLGKTFGGMASDVAGAGGGVGGMVKGLAGGAIGQSVIQKQIVMQQVVMQSAAGGAGSFFGGGGKGGIPSGLPGGGGIPPQLSGGPAGLLGAPKVGLMGRIGGMARGVGAFLNQPVTGMGLGAGALAVGGGLAIGQGVSKGIQWFANRGKKEEDRVTYGLGEAWGSAKGLLSNATGMDFGGGITTGGRKKAEEWQKRQRESVGGFGRISEMGTKTGLAAEAKLTSQIESLQAKAAKQHGPAQEATIKKISNLEKKRLEVNFQIAKELSFQEDKINRQQAIDSQRNRGLSEISRRERDISGNIEASQKADQGRIDNTKNLLNEKKKVFAGLDLENVNNEEVEKRRTEIVELENQLLDEQTGKVKNAASFAERQVGFSEQQLSAEKSIEESKGMTAEKVENFAKKDIAIQKERLKNLDIEIMGYDDIKNSEEKKAAMAKRSVEVVKLEVMEREKNLKIIEQETKELEAQKALQGARLDNVRESFKSVNEIRSALKDQRVAEEDILKNAEKRFEEVKKTKDVGSVEYKEAQRGVEAARLAVARAGKAEIREPAAEREKQLDIMKRIQQSGANTNELLKKSPMITGNYVREQIELAKANVALQQDTLNQLKANPNANPTEIKEQQLKVVSAIEEVASLTDKYRRTFEEQFSALTMNLEKGSYIYRTETSKMAQVGPTFQPFGEDLLTEKGELRGRGTRTAIMAAAGMGGPEVTKLQEQLLDVMRQVEANTRDGVKLGK